MKTGFATIPMERYDQLILENRRLMEELDNSVSQKEYDELAALIEEAIDVNDNWDEPELRINTHVLRDIIEDKLKQTKYADTYKLSAHSYKNIYSAFEKLKDDNDTEDDQA